MRQKLFHAYWVFLAPIALKLLKCLQIRAQATLDSGIGSLESIPGLLKPLQIRAQATLASGIGSLESIPGLSLSPKHLRSPGIDSKEPENQGTRNQEPTLCIGESRGVADSPYRRVGESPTPRISESGSRYLIYNKLQNFISQKITKLFERNFQRAFLYTYTASSANLSSLALT